MNKPNLYNRGRSFIGIIIVIIVVLLIGVGLFFYLNSKRANIPEIIQKEQEQITQEKASVFDLSKCEEMFQPYMKHDCYSNVAKVKQDLSICNKIYS